jgi:hypothetical protein
LETTAAYLKVINVPCMYDLGTPTVDPYDHQLLLNIMDDLTYYKAIKPDFLDKKGRRAMHKIEKFKQAMQASHINVYVSEVDITILGKVKVSRVKGKER